MGMNTQSCTTRDFRRHIHRACSAIVKNPVSDRLGKTLMDFHDWITDPPMTERDRINRWITEARAEARKRHLLRRY